MFKYENPAADTCLWDAYQPYLHKSCKIIDLSSCESALLKDILEKKTQFVSEFTLALQAPRGCRSPLPTERFIYYRKSVLHLFKRMFHVRLTLVMMGGK